jgi:hypothetical protein
MDITTKKILDVDYSWPALFKDVLEHYVNELEV